MASPPPSTASPAPPRPTRLDAVPALEDGRVGKASEGGELVENESIEMQFVEDVYGEAVLVGVANWLGLRGSLSQRQRQSE